MKLLSMFLPATDKINLLKNDCFESVIIECFIILWVSALSVMFATLINIYPFLFLNIIKELWYWQNRKNTTTASHLICFIWICYKFWNKVFRWQSIFFIFLRWIFMFYVKTLSLIFFWDLMALNVLNYSTVLLFPCNKKYSSINSRDSTRTEVFL